MRRRTHACFNALQLVEHTVLPAAGFVETFSASEASLTSRQLYEVRNETAFTRMWLRSSPCVFQDAHASLLVAPMPRCGESMNSGTPF